MVVRPTFPGPGRLVLRLLFADRSGKRTILRSDGTWSPWATMFGVEKWDRR